MNLAFISFSIIDVLDILLIAFLMYQIYNLIKGTIAYNIFIAVIGIWLLSMFVQLLNMTVTWWIISRLIQVGVIALIIVFQQELRRFLLIMGSKYLANPKLNLGKLLFSKLNEEKKDPEIFKFIASACDRLAEIKTGALIVLGREEELISFSNTGDMLNADISSRLIESIFKKDSPLHDGAIIIYDNKLIAARCILPLSNDLNIPANFGMRHRAAIGVTEIANAHVVTVSEETGKISFFSPNERQIDISPSQIEYFLREKYM